MRLVINEVDGVEDRFRISQEPDFAVMDKQLTFFNAPYHMEDDKVTISSDIVGTYFVMQLSPFRIESYVDDVLVMRLNENDSLYFERSTGKNDDVCMEHDTYATQIDY